MSVFNLPPELESLRPAFEKSLRPYIRIKPSSEHIPTLWNSKFGGNPYLPKNADYPQNKGKNLLFLAQVNFAEMPAIQGFPRNGLLQFFISDDPMYGLNIGKANEQTSFRVVYHETVVEDASELITDFSFLTAPQYSPIRKECACSFEIAETPIGQQDIRFEELIPNTVFSSLGEKEWDIRNDLNKCIKNSGHRLGGYPFFTQEDPRMDSSNYDTLLFQLDSDDEAAIQWGDMGICNFFIHSEKLIKAQFDDVLYNWDCY